MAVEVLYPVRHDPILTLLRDWEWRRAELLAPLLGELRRLVLPGRISFKCPRHPILSHTTSFRQATALQQ